jgi:predicted Zn-dependent peptidase
MNWRALLAVAVLIAAATGASADSPKRLRLPNGLRVVLKPTFATDVVAIELLLDVSAADEPADQQGLRYLLQRLLLRGTASESGERMARRLAEVGGVAEATVGLDYVEIYALTPADGFETALEIIAEAAQSPALAPVEFEAQRRAAQETARAARDDPFQETYLAFREALYRDHPYGKLTLGAPGSLAGITRDDLALFHQRNYVPNRAVLAICGGVGEARVMAAVRQAFSDWSPGLPTPERHLPPVQLTMSDVSARERPVRRAHLMIGFPAPAAAEDGYYAVQVIDSILGGGATGRLTRRLRDELGLVYDISSFHPTLAGESHFAVYAVTEQYQLEAVKAAVLDLIADLQNRPVSEAELSRAKAYLLGSYALSHQRMKDEAYALAWYEILGLGVDFAGRYTAAVSAVTSGQVQEAARELFQHLVLAVMLPSTPLGGGPEG